MHLPDECCRTASEPIKALIIQEPNMNNGTEQLKQFSQTSLDAASRLSHIALTGAAQLTKLQLDSAKAALQETTGNSRALLTVTQPQEFMSLQSQIAEAQIKSAISLGKSMYDVAAQTQGEFAKFAEERYAEFNKSMVTMLDQAGKSAPGADMAVASIKSTMAATTAAIESMTRAAKQAVGMAEANFKAAADSASKTVVKA
jgi:phasin family protein